MHSLGDNPLVTALQQAPNITKGAYPGVRCPLSVLKEWGIHFLEDIDKPSETPVVTLNIGT